MFQHCCCCCCCIDIAVAVVVIVVVVVVSTLLLLYQPCWSTACHPFILVIVVVVVVFVVCRSRHCCCYCIKTWLTPHFQMTRLGHTMFVVSCRLMRKAVSQMHCPLFVGKKIFSCPISPWRRSNSIGKHTTPRAASSHAQRRPQCHPVELVIDFQQYNFFFFFFHFVFLTLNPTKTHKYRQTATAHLKVKARNSLCKIYAQFASHLR